MVLLPLPTSFSMLSLRYKNNFLFFQKNNLQNQSSKLNDKILLNTKQRMNKLEAFILKHNKQNGVLE